MPDIKLKPQMDKPKVLEVSRAPKDAGSILKEQYEAQQNQRKPAERGPVQYATDKVETTARRGTALAADGARRGAKRHKEAAGERKAQRQAQAAYEDTRAAQRDAQAQGQTTQPQQSRQQTQALDPQAQEPPYQRPREQGQRRFIRERRQQAAQGGTGRAYSGYDGGRGAQAAPDTLHPPTARERGRLKAIEDNKSRIKTRNLTEKENAALRGLKGSAEQGTQGPVRIKQKKVSVKTGNAAVRSAAAKDRLMTPAAVAAKKAKQEAQKKMQKQMLKQAAAKAKKAAQETAKATVRIAKAAARAIAAAAKAIVAAGGGVVLLVVILLVALIAAIAASPFGIFFSGENTGPDAVPVSAAVAEINSDFNARLEALQAGEYDDVVIHGVAADWPEVLAVFASRVAGADGSEAADVVTIDRERIEKLKTVFWDMTAISSYVQEIEHGDSDPDDEVDDSWTEYILHITIAAKSVTEMQAFYGFTPRQASSMNELLANRAMLVELIGSLSIISADASAVLDNLPADLSAERKAVIKTACSLVGKVNYFWGGKSYVIGWDTRWGQVRKVWADGSSTTGTYRPYGLDCSGFVDWVFYNITEGDYIIGHGGGAAKQHEYSNDIAWADAQPGDLVFYPGDEHVGIVGSRDESGNLLIIHCTSGYNNVVITGIEGFIAIARPNYYSE